MKRAFYSMAFGRPPGRENPNSFGVLATVAET
jgi:hypothetical protein